MFELLLFLKDIVFFAGYISTGNSFPPPLTPQEEQRALKEMKEGSAQARETLISHNLRLVAHVAKRYSSKKEDLDDLISIGTIGLIKAVSSFDSEKGAGLATYAARCINNEILMSLRAAKKQKNEVSIHAAIGTDNEGNEITLADIMGTKPTEVPDYVELGIDVSRAFEIVEKYLTKREQTVIILRYGLSGRPCMPQREVAKLLGISRSYISRIEKKALQKMAEHMT